jgi:hypothetical protein
MYSRGFKVTGLKIWQRVSIANFIGDIQLHESYQVVFENIFSIFSVIFNAAVTYLRFLDNRTIFIKFSLYIIPSRHWRVD